MAASSLLILRNDRRSPLRGDARRRRLASRTTSGRNLGVRFATLALAESRGACARGHRGAWRRSSPCRIRPRRRAPGGSAWTWAHHQGRRWGYRPPRARSRARGSFAKPTSCTIRSRAKRFAVSTMIVRTPLPAIALQHVGKARRGLDRIRTRHGSVIELAGELVTGALGECLDRLALAPIAVLVGPDIGRRARAEVGECLFRSLRHFANHCWVFPAILSCILK